MGRLDPGAAAGQKRGGGGRVHWEGGGGGKATEKGMTDQKAPGPELPCPASQLIKWRGFQLTQGRTIASRID